MTDVVLVPDTCGGCDRSLRFGWEFRADDLRCALCGAGVYRTAVGQEVQVAVAGGTDTEVWAYLSAAGAARLPVAGRVGRLPVPPRVRWDDSAARLTLPEAGAGRCSLTPVGQPHPTHFDLGLRPSAPLPPTGVRGRLTLADPTGVSQRSLRLLPAPPADWATLAPDGGDGSAGPAVGYRQPDGGATIRLTLVGGPVTTAVATIWAGGDQTVGLREIRLARASQVRPGAILPPAGRLSLLVRAAEVQPAPPPGGYALHLRLWLVGREDPLDVRLPLALRQAPAVRVEPEPKLEPLSFGQVRPVTVQLIGGPGGESPRVTARLRVADGSPPGWAALATTWPGLIDIPPAPGLPLPMVLRATDLPRGGPPGRVLEADLVLTDQAGQVWRHPVRAECRRLPPLPVPLALDWGTTNTCAAWVDGAARPNSVRFVGQLSPGAFEVIPSDVYVTDLSDPDRPAFHLGADARLQANIDHRSESLLVSLKRRFARGGTVWLVDPAGAGRAVEVDHLVRLVIRKLVLMAEQAAGQEVRAFGVTFPTKWPAAARRRMAAVLERVRQDLAGLNGEPAAVTLLPPRIDEANAVALNLLDELSRTDKLQPGADLVVVAYDFGGGTVDTSVLRVRYDPAADPFLVTEYLGVGGLAEFGGDDVTRAALRLLEQRLAPALKATPTGYRLPLLAGGDAPPKDVPAGWYQAGRENWERLWEVAERIKMDLCAPTLPNGPPVAYYLPGQMAEIRCLAADGTSTDLNDALNAVPGRDAEGVVAGLEFGLPDLYAFEWLLADSTPVTVRGRVEELAGELKEQCRAAGRPPDFVVLAGGGCRLPLVADSLKTALGVAADKLVYDPAYAKQRVAHGKAWYANVQATADLDGGLAASVDVLHRPLAVAGLPLQRPPYHQVAPVGTGLDAPGRWHPFALHKWLVRGEPAGRQVVLLGLGWRDRSVRAGPVGWFAVDAPGPGLAGDPPAEAVPLPADLWDATDRPTGHVRLAVGPAGPRLDLCVTAGGRRFGPYPLVTPEADADRRADHLTGVPSPT